MEGGQRNSLSDKQKSCIQKNLLLQKSTERLSVSLQTEKNLYERRMDLEAKNLKKKLTLLIPINKPSTNSPKRDNESKTLKLPEIGNGVSSAPCSPTLKRISSDIWGANINVPRLSKASLSPPTPDTLPVRRGSCNDADLFKSSPLLVRRAACRKTSLPKERRVSSVPGPVVQEDEQGSPRVSTTNLVPRNLKLRIQARRESCMDDPDWSDTVPTSPSLGKQFVALGSCRYLRRSIGEDDDDVIKENGET